jgi:tetratricopeptide (TPR) repeat protein
MERRAEQGSTTAQNYLESKRLNALALKHFDQHEYAQAASLLRKSLRLSSDLGLATADLQRNQLLLLKVKSAFKRLGEANADAMLFCAILMDSSEPSMLRKGLAHAQHCASLYPEDAEFVQILATWYSLNRDYTSAVKCNKRAVEMQPKRAEWLYQLAENLYMAAKVADKNNNEQMCSLKEQEAIDTFEKYVELNAVDERNMPKAYYQLALLYAMRDEFTRAEELFKKAVDAEEKRLPCFDAIGDDYKPKKKARAELVAASAAGRYASKFSSKSRNYWRPPANSYEYSMNDEDLYSKPVPTRVTCERCSKKMGQVTFACGKCQIKCYCSAQCKKRGSKIHDAQCSRSGSETDNSV